MRDIMRRFTNFIAFTMTIAAVSVASMSAQSFSGSRTGSVKTIEHRCLRSC